MISVVLFQLLSQRKMLTNGHHHTVGRQG